MPDPIWDDRPSPQRAPTEQELLEACVNPFRRDLLVLLRMAPRVGKFLSNLLGVSPQVISREMHILSKAGLVWYERDKNFHVFRLTGFLTIEFASADTAVLNAQAANRRKVCLEFQIPSTHINVVRPVIRAWLESRNDGGPVPPTGPSCP